MLSVPSVRAVGCRGQGPFAGAETPPPGQTNERGPEPQGWLRQGWAGRVHPKGQQANQGWVSKSSKEWQLMGG
eukprot:7455542-Lingulodinium_polyedra.AAC.1